MIRGFQIPALLVGTCMGLSAVAHPALAAPQAGSSTDVANGTAVPEPLQAAPAAPAPAAAPEAPAAAPEAPAAAPEAPAAAPEAPAAAPEEAPAAAPEAPTAAPEAPAAAPEAPAAAPSVAVSANAASITPPSGAATSDGPELEYPGYVPGYRGSAAVGLSPYAPDVNAPLGGTTPAFGSKIRPQSWTLDFDGSFIWYGSAGIGKNGRTGATTFHLPGKADTGFNAPSVANASFGFSVSQGPVSTRVNFGTGKDDFRVSYLPALIPELQMEITFGTTDFFYNANALGVQTFTQWQADPYLNVDFTQRIGLVSTTAQGDSMIAQEYGVSANYDGNYAVGVDYKTFSSQDAAPVKFADNGTLTEAWAPDGRLDILSTSLNWFGDELGEANLGVTYVKAFEPVPVTPGLPDRLSKGFIGAFAGRNKSAAFVEAGYTVSLFRFIDPQYYDPDGRDLKFHIDGQYVKPIDPLPEVADYGDFYKLHLNVSYRIFGGVVVWSDLNYTEPSVKREDNSDSQRYADIETTVQFKTRPLSPEYFELSWAHAFPPKAKANKVMAINPGDTEVFEFRAGIYW